MQKAFIIFSFLVLPYVYGQENKASEITIGIGILHVNTTYPIYLYKDINDTLPFADIVFKKHKSGTTTISTALDLKPNSISEGGTHKADRELIKSGLAPTSKKLNFIVTEASEYYFKVVTNKETNEAFFIKREKQHVYYKTKGALFQNSCSNCADSNYNPRWFIFETWERYLKRVHYIEKPNLILYDKPNGDIIFKNNDHSFLPFNVVEVKGDWIKLKKATGRENMFDASENYDGWTQWKNGNEILITIIESMFI
ncbi:hypothetical protein I2486_17720 [Cellulophaga sp. E16_2]|uniref:hypothetical protein n=1 Tax=Cellulophaga sp. E16_2 TaxID=2789297 RepID=UPI001A918155|nr:hypothetical protein [Cellulophaga sp. E16_2]MBO0593246.1 hypothetical protein [Cellulophaga sp. E16_2]